MKRKNSKQKKEKGILQPANEFSIIKNSQKVYLDKQGKIRQDINYTLIPKAAKSKYRKLKLLLLIFLFGLFLAGGVMFMSFAYEYPIQKTIFEFADNYLFVGGITLLIYLVFKKKK